MMRTALIVSLSFLAVAATGKPAQAVTLDFEEFATPLNFNLQPPSFTSKGFTLTVLNRELAIVRDDQPNIPDTGSNTLVANGDDAEVDALSSFRLEQTSGEPFSLLSLLAAEGRNTNGAFFPEFSATQIQVMGTFALGGTISTVLTLDLFAQENNALDFQPFSFIGFTGLSHVDFTGTGGPRNGYAFGLDDIVVVAQSVVVPEPAIATLSLLSVAGLMRRRRIV